MYTCICIYLLESPMDQGAWWATFHGVANSQTWLKWLAHTHIYLSIYLSINMYLNHFAVHLYLTQHCKATIVQFFKKPNSDSGTCSPWSLGGITTVSCHAIQWRESNLWTGLSWKSKWAKLVSLKCSAWDWHREEPSNGLLWGMTRVSCGFCTGWQSRASPLGILHSKGPLKAEALAWVSPSLLRSPWPCEYWLESEVWEMQWGMPIDLQSGIRYLPCFWLCLPICKRRRPFQV